MIHIPGTEDECCAQLKRILAKPVLAMAGRSRPLTPHHIVSA